MRSALLAADLVLIPVQPSPLDGWASAEMLALLSEARIYRPQLAARFVLNRCGARTVIARETAETLADHDPPCSPPPSASASSSPTPRRPAGSLRRTGRRHRPARARSRRSRPRSSAWIGVHERAIPEARLRLAPRRSRQLDQGAPIRHAARKRSRVAGFTAG
jgi:hypothetical protein